MWRRLHPDNPTCPDRGSATRAVVLLPPEKVVAARAARAVTLPASIQLSNSSTSCRRSTMLRLHDGQVSLWEHVLPEEVRLLSAELTVIDALLDDDRFLAPFARRFACGFGRPTIPIDTYLRLMYLKHRHGLGYETLVKEVSDSLSWRQFCRLSLSGSVPHPTTLLKLTRRFGPELVEELNGALLRTAVERRVLQSRRLRVVTTGVDADLRYPTDSGLCAHAVSRLTRAVRRVQAAGLAAGARCRNRTRSV